MNKKQAITIGVGIVGLVIIGAIAYFMTSSPSADENRKVGFGLRDPSSRTERYLAGTLNDGTTGRGFGLRYPFKVGEKTYSLSTTDQSVTKSLDSYGKDKKSIIVKGKLKGSGTIAVSDVAIIPNGTNITISGTLTKRTNDPDWQYTFNGADGGEYRANSIGANNSAINNLVGQNVSTKGIVYRYVFLKETVSGLYISEATAITGTGVANKPVITKVTPDSAASGDEITITGQNLGFDENGKISFEVAFDDQYLAFTTQGLTTELKIPVPYRVCTGTTCKLEELKPGSYKFTIRTAGGISNAVSFTVKEKTTP
jgi:hypothetical protein